MVINAGFARFFDIVNGFLIDAVAVSYQHVWLRLHGASDIITNQFYMIIWLR